MELTGCKTYPVAFLSLSYLNKDKWRELVPQAINSVVTEHHTEHKCYFTTLSVATLCSTEHISRLSMMTLDIAMRESNYGYVKLTSELANR
jgi:hypothetical protein